MTIYYFKDVLYYCVVNTLKQLKKHISLENFADRIGWFSCNPLKYLIFYDKYRFRLRLKNM